MAKAGTIVKSASVVDGIATAVVKLEVAAAAGDKAVAVRSKAAKQNKALVTRLAKRRGALIKRRKTTKRKLAKTPGAALRHDLRAIEKDLSRSTKELTKAKAVKASNAGELAVLKAVQRYAHGYRKAIQQVDRALGKRTKKRG